MSAVDNRVVQMEFDNSRFERNVSTSISTLGRLKSALKLNGASDGLATIEKSASGGLNLAGIGTAVEQISKRFSAFGIIGTTILQDIGHMAFQAGSRIKGMIDDLTFKQVNAGFSKYEEKTKSVQTIMAATAETWLTDADAMMRAEKLMESGMNARAAYDYASAYTKVENGLLDTKAAAEQLRMTLKEYEKISNDNVGALGSDITYAGSQMDYVNDQMAKLNWFSDETSYSFTDMVSNVGKFTANNIPLSQAATAMQGIATWAAISGQDAQAASRAMYNLSQAIGVGSVKLMDWKSIENANMATSAFKKNAIEAGVAMGYLEKTTDGLYKTTKKAGKAGQEVTLEGFSQTLSAEWFKKDVLLNVLDQYGAFTDELYKVSDASDLTASQLLELVEAQKKGQLSQTQLNEVAAEGSISAEKLRAEVERLAGDNYELGYQSFRAAQEAKSLNDALEATKDAASTGWMNIFENIFGNYDRARKVWTGFAEFLYDTLVSPLEIINEMSLGFVAPLDQFGNKLRKASKAANTTTQDILDLVEAERNGTLTQEMLNEVAEKGGVEVELLSAKIGDLATDSWGDFTDALTDASKETGILSSDLLKLVEAQKEGALEEAKLEAAAKKAGISTEDLRAKVEELADIGNISGLDRVVGGIKSIWDYLFSTKENESGIFGNIIRGIQRVIPGLDLSREAVTRALKKFQEFGESLKLDAVWGGRLRLAGEGLGKVFLFIGNSLKNYWNATQGLRSSIGNLVTSVAGFIVKIFTLGRGIDETGLKGQIFQKICDKIASVINKVSDAISKVKIDDLKERFSGISSILKGVSNAFSWVIQQIANFNLGETFGTVIDWIKQKFESLKTFLSGFDFGKIFKGAAGTGALALIGTKLYKSIKNMTSPFESLKGVGEKINGILEGISGALKSFETKTKVDSFKKIAASILMLAAALLILGFVNYDNAITGIVAIAGIMAGLYAAFNAIGDIDKGKMATMAASMLLAAAAMLVMAVALAALAGALALFTLVSRMDDVADGFAIMAGTLAVALISLKVMSKMSPKVIVAAAALAVFAASLLLLAAAVAAFALVVKMNTVWQGLAVMAAGLLVVVAALIVLGEIALKALVGAAALLVVSAALLVLAGALAAFSAIAGMETFGTGLAAMALMLLLLVGALVALGATGPMVLVGAAAMLVAAAACVVLAAAIAAVGVAMPLLALGLAALGAGIGSALGSIGAGVGSFLTGVSAGITAAGQAIGSLVAEIGSGIGSAVAALGAGVGESISSIIASVGVGIGDGITAISDAIGSFGENLTKAGDGITELGNSIRSLDGISWTSTAIGIGELALALKKLNPEDLASSMGPAAQAVTAMCTQMTTSIGTVVPQITAMSQQLGQAIVTGITSQINTVSATISTALTSCVSIIGSYYSSFYGTGANLGAGLANGIQSQIARVASAAASMVSSAIEAAREAAKEGSPSKITTQSGIYFGMGYANGILSQRRNVSAAADAMVAGSMKVLNNARTLISSILEDDFTPVITPVLDTSSVSRSLSSISNASVMTRASVISDGVQTIQNARNAAATAAATNNRTDNVTNLYIDGIKYNTDDYVDSSISSFVETLIRKQKMYA